MESVTLLVAAVGCTLIHFGNESGLYTASTRGPIGAATVAEVT